MQIKNPLARWIRREFLHAYHSLNPRSRWKTAKWHEADAPDFLTKIGVKPGDIVIDFGCGPGFFCLPAAKVVGNSGCVYAVDNNQRVLRKLQKKAVKLNLENLHTASCMLETVARLKGCLCDFVLIYDMLHFLDRDERCTLFTGLRNILAENGRVSVHLKHVKGDDPGRYFADMTAEDVVREIEMTGFRLSEKIRDKIWHSYNANDSIVYNFTKRQE